MSASRVLVRRNFKFFFGRSVTLFFIRAVTYLKREKVTQTPNILLASSLMMRLNLTFRCIFWLGLFLIGLFWACSSADRSSNQVQKNPIFPSAEQLPVQPTLPPLLARLTDAKEISMNRWEEQRSYLKEMLAHYQYGQMPPKPDDFLVKTLGVESTEQWIEERLQIILERNEQKAAFTVGIRRPKETGRLPVIIKNDAHLFDLSDIQDSTTLAKYQRRRRDTIQSFVNKELLQRGYVQCKFLRNELAPDRPHQRDVGIFRLYPEYDWGNIAAWAWAYQPIIDYLLDQSYIDAEKIVVTGHSRGGKTALCAGIYDERIAITAPNSSGSGGTGSWRYFDPEQEAQVLRYHQERFPYWWTEKLYQFVGKPQKLPFDAHTAKALVAPRALINTHARQDYWANPYGTYLTYQAALVVFDALEVTNHQAIHWRDGGHNQNEEDWQALLDYCDFIFYGKPIERPFDQSPHPQYEYSDIAVYDVSQ